MTELKGPCLTEIKNFIKNKSLVTFYLINDKMFTGQILWRDEETFHLQLEDNKVITILKKAVIYYSKA